MIPATDRDPVDALSLATQLLPQLIERGDAVATGLRVQHGEHSWKLEPIGGSIREWLSAPGYTNAIAIDLRTPGEAVLAHADVLCRMRYARDRIDFTVRDIVCDGPAMHDPGIVAALESFTQDHLP